MTSTDRPILYLCAGTQSSGSTLVSWCFLQRQDMDGILDQRGDILPAIDPALARPFAWCKFTVNCFRLGEATTYFEEQGWEVRPLLVVRDVRSVLNSLVNKSYGRNGVTAEEPPLRMRMRRFKEDWEAFRGGGGAMLQYERFVTHPEAALREVCEKLALPWDEGMLLWSKAKSDIAAPIHGNATFRQTRGQSLQETVNPSLAKLKVDAIPPADLAWLESEFAEFNRVEGYPAHAERTVAWTGEIDRLMPRWENTRRYKKKTRRNLLMRAARALRGA
jgi:hypothetical protein